MRFTRFHNVSYSSTLTRAGDATSGNCRLSCKSKDRSPRSIDSCSGIGSHLRGRTGVALVDCAVLAQSAQYRGLLITQIHQGTSPTAPGTSRRKTAKNRRKPSHVCCPEPKRRAVGGQQPLSVTQPKIPCAPLKGSHARVSACA